MEVIFKFNLPDDHEEYEIYKQAEKMNLALWDFSQQLRAWYKHYDKDPSLEEIRDKFHEILDQYKITLE